MKYRGINHLAMVTGDMNATIRFWRDFIGMRLINGFGGKGFRHYFSEIDEKKGGIHTGFQNSARVLFTALACLFSCLSLEKLFE